MPPETKGVQEADFFWGFEVSHLNSRIWCNVGCGLDRHIVVKASSVPQPPQVPVSPEGSSYLAVTWFGVCLA